VIQNFRVDELWIGRDEETAAFETLLKEARARGIRIVHEVSGNRFDWDGITGNVLWPADLTPVNEASNDDSLVLRLEDGSIRFLLSGDIQKKVEQRLVAQHAEITADFLKVPHHGSKTSSTPDFVGAVAPKVAVVSAGEANPFGHPAPGTIERYAQAGVHLLRTDRDGIVTALTDGHTLTVTTFAESHPN
jgi:competence protein ComEC